MPASQWASESGGFLAQSVLTAHFFDGLVQLPIRCCGVSAYFVYYHSPVSVPGFRRLILPAEVDLDVRVGWVWVSSGVRNQATR